MAHRVDGHRADGGVTAAEAGRIERFTQPAGSYRDSRARDAAVFIPDSYTGQTPVPMVMVLHGCQQTNQNMIDETAFTDLAERDGFIVVFPFITSYDGLRNPELLGLLVRPAHPRGRRRSPRTCTGSPWRSSRTSASIHSAAM